LIFSTLRSFAACTALFALMWCAGMESARSQGDWAARAVSVQGTVQVMRIGEQQWQAVRLNDTFRPGDTIRVMERSRADLTLLDQSVLRLNANTTMTLQALEDRSTWVVDLLRGAAYFFSTGPRRLDVRTGFATAGVRGTEFVVTADDDQATITMLDGTVVAQNPNGSVTLSAGQQAVARAGGAPEARTVVRPRDAVQWALYYPPVLQPRTDSFAGKGDWDTALQQSVAARQRGDLQGAFDAIAALPDAVNDPQVYAYRASLLLAIGQVDAAEADLRRALEMDPRNGDALSLQSVIAVARGRNDEALAAAQAAVQAGPDSATPHIALSYAQQARFELSGARDSLRTAVKRDPRNALAWARLAELESALGDTKAALDAARRAGSLQPELPRSQSVLGYAYLSGLRMKPARQAFEKAIALDSSDPLARMGLGLAKIRSGDLAEGAHDLEIARSLDPGNALVRSYGGKAYFEEKRNALAAREYAIAKDLDARDPTPWFYDAILEQTENRPVEALQDLEQAIELNDNRAVYRSRLLLDADLAARGASLGRLYSDLGYEQLALREGWKSVNIDPTSYSGHRLLADSYASLPRHEIARVSELLQSQLMQPVGLNPIQPRLSESNLFLISAGGPGALSFNEFNQLFTRNGLTVQANGMAGNHETTAGELIVSGLYDRFAFSLGGFDFDTEGWRANADQKDTLGNIFLQYDFAATTGLQFEYRKRDLDFGDVRLYFFDDDAQPGLRNSATTETYRAGLRHSFSPRWMLLASYLQQDDERSTQDSSNPAALAAIDEPDTEGQGGELQVLYRGDRFSLVAGGGTYKLDREQGLLVIIPDPFFPLELVDATDADVEHTNAYVYSYINLSRAVTVTLGGSFDWFDADSTTESVLSSGGIPLGPSTTTDLSRSQEPFNPKLGITVQLQPGTTLRAAAFRALKRSLIANQTLEPTQVAGFNQFYDDIEGTQSTHIGVALDQKFSRTLYGGISLSHRDLEVPVLFTDPFSGTTSVLEKDWSEEFVRPYLFWTPHPRVALSAEYQYENFERTADNVNFGFERATTQKLPLGARYFHPSGLTLGVKTTYVSQDGSFTPKGGNCCVDGNSDFWLVDAALSYRLPRRLGFLSVGVTNLFDQRFDYQETDFNNPTILPSRSVFGRISLSLP
jgi:tetratricopeptide (TPR) repeat protein